MRFFMAAIVAAFFVCGIANACDCQVTGECHCIHCECLNTVAAQKPVGGNFTVSSPDIGFSRKVLAAAEKYRLQLSNDWFGDEMPTWSQPCPIFVTLTRGNGGSTSFTFDNGEVFGWRMNVQGTPEGILESVLPHEVLHTVFASHLRHKLPRWADEGACSTIEPKSEVRRLHHSLHEFLNTGRGVPFARMVAMFDYPEDIMPVYAQGESVVDFLLQHDGKQHYTGRFLKAGIESGDWKGSLLAAYGYENLGQLQNAWLDWYKAGSPRNPDMVGVRHSTGYG